MSDIYEKIYSEVSSMGGKQLLHYLAKKDMSHNYHELISGSIFLRRGGISASVFSPSSDKNKPISEILAEKRIEDGTWMLYIPKHVSYIPNPDRGEGGPSVIPSGPKLEILLVMNDGKYVEPSELDENILRRVIGDVSNMPDGHLKYVIDEYNGKIDMGL